MKYDGIEIEGLPEGWEPVALRKQKLGEYVFCLETGCVVPADHRTPKVHLIVKKKQPRRIVFEESDYDVSVKYDGRYWRIVKEGDLSLNNEEPKLSIDEKIDKIFEGLHKAIEKIIKDNK